MNYVIGFGVPFACLFFGALCKKLTSGKPWEEKDWYLGSELTLGATISALSHLSDLWVRLRRKDDPTSEEWGAAVFFIVMALGSQLVVMSFHQDWEAAAECPGKRRRLLWVCNGIGLTLVTIFLVWVKGVE